MPACFKPFTAAPVGNTVGVRSSIILLSGRIVTRPPGVSTLILV